MVASVTHNSNFRVPARHVRVFAYRGDRSPFFTKIWIDDKMYRIGPFGSDCSLTYLRPVRVKFGSGRGAKVYTVRTKDGAVELYWVILQRENKIDFGEHIEVLSISSE